MQRADATLVLILINGFLFLLDTLGLPFSQNLYLHHNSPQIHAFVTSMFCHSSWAHLSGNIFFLYFFGKEIEGEKGPRFLVLSYLACGLLGNLLSYAFSPTSVSSLGASGAVYGLFVVSIGIKLAWDWRKCIEIVVLGQFVVQTLLTEITQMGSRDGIDHPAHIGGALGGGLLVLGAKKLFDRTQRKKKP